LSYDGRQRIECRKYSRNVYGPPKIIINGVIQRQEWHKLHSLYKWNRSVQMLELEKKNKMKAQWYNTCKRETTSDLAAPSIWIILRFMQHGTSLSLSSIRHSRRKSNIRVMFRTTKQKRSTFWLDSLSKIHFSSSNQFFFPYSYKNFLFPKGKICWNQKL